MRALLMLLAVGCAHPVPPETRPAPEAPLPPPACPTGMVRSCGCQGLVVREHTVCPCMTPAMLAECEVDLSA